MWFEDLAPWGRSPRILTIGWLERGREYQVGDVPAEVYEKLKRLLANPWQPVGTCGMHGCDLCSYEPEKGGTANVVIPSDKCVFFAPELILHYMNAHQYRPPEEFCSAVAACPPMGTMEYRRALLAAGGPGILKEFSPD